MVELIEDPDALREKCRVKDSCLGAISSDCASLWPYKLITFILERAIKSGLNLQTNTPVIKIDNIEDPTSSYRQLVQTSHGTIKARHLILATNGYTSYLLPEFNDLIVPERGTMSALLPPKGSTHLAYSHGFKGTKGSDPSHDDYLTQRPFEGVPNPRGHLMYGGGQNFAQQVTLGTSDDSFLDDGCATYLRRELLHLLDFDGETNGMEELEATHQWSGIWGTSRDGSPWVGAVPDREGVWLVGGYSGESDTSITFEFYIVKDEADVDMAGHGMPNGTLCGKAAVEMVLAEESGASLVESQDKLVKNDELPQCYLVSKERMDGAEKMDPILTQQLKKYAKHMDQAPRHVVEAMMEQDIKPSGMHRSSIA